MAYITVTQAISKIVLDAKLSVVKDVKTFLESKIDTDLSSYFVEFTESLEKNEKTEMKASLKDAKKKNKKNSTIEKKVREPSVYNLYVKDMMKSFKEKNPDIKDGKELMKMLGNEWKTGEIGVFLGNKIAELKSSNNMLTVQEAYTQAKKEWETKNKVDENKVKKTTKK